MPCRHGSFPQNCRDRAMLAIASFIIPYLDWQARKQFLVGLSETATNHSCGFRPIRFLHPGPFAGTESESVYFYITDEWDDTA